MPVSIKDFEAKYKPLAEKMLTIKSTLAVDEQRIRIEVITTSLNNPAVWGDAEKMASMNKEKRSIENKLLLFSQLEKVMDDAQTLMELISVGEDMGTEPEEAIEKAQDIIAKLEFQKMLGGKTDANNAILNINAGAGGRESQDWAVMLSRMYLRWAERRGMSADVTDRISGDDAAGIKSLTMIISGEYAYGYLKAESGVHRLVRISPFDANKRRHTSFASVFVTPEVDDSVDIDIDEKDLKIDTYRAGGAGGQHVNKTDSAVRITHLPSKIVVQCQNDRSQHKNKATAMKILRSKLYEFEMDKKLETAMEQQKQKKDIDFGSQIRSYVLHPYKMVKDHRFDFEAGNAEAVLDGEEILDRIMEDYLLKSGGSNEK